MESVELELVGFLGYWSTGSGVFRRGYFGFYCCLDGGVSVVRFHEQLGF